jgi:hypothetical protein
VDQVDDLFPDLRLVACALGPQERVSPDRHI